MVRHNFDTYKVQETLSRGARRGFLEEVIIELNLKNERKIFLQDKCGGGQETLQVHREACARSEMY